MVSVIVVTCSSGHKFPVNLKKHLNRRERLCPKCYEEVVVKKRFSFMPSAEWIKQKKLKEEKKRMEKQIKQLKRMGLKPMAIAGSPNLFPPKPRWEDKRE